MVAMDKLKKLFEKYANDPADNLPGKIGPNGMVRLLEDLKIDPEDRKVLVLAYKMGAEVMCEFSWEEWERGMRDMGADSAATLRKKLETIDNGLKNAANFEPVYKFAFTYGKMAGQRNLDLEVAIVYWKILFGNQFALLPMWEEFMRKEHRKPITKDVWNRLFDFFSEMKTDLSNYDEEEAWPCVLDSFVTWAKPRVAKC